MSFPIYVKTNLWIAKLISETECVSIYLDSIHPKISNIKREREHTKEYRAYLANSTETTTELEWQLYHRIALGIYMNGFDTSIYEEVSIDSWGSDFKIDLISSRDYIVCTGPIQATVGGGISKPYSCSLWCNRWGGVGFMQMQELGQPNAVLVTGYIHLTDTTEIFMSLPREQQPPFGVGAQNTLYKSGEQPEIEIVPLGVVFNQQK